MSSRRPLNRLRDIVSFGRRTPRFNFVVLKRELNAAPSVRSLSAHSSKHIKPERALGPKKP